MNPPYTIHLHKDHPFLVIICIDNCIAYAKDAWRERSLMARPEHHFIFNHTIDLGANQSLFFPIEECALIGACGKAECDNSMCRLTLASDRVPRGRRVAVALAEEAPGY